MEISPLNPWSASISSFLKNVVVFNSYPNGNVIFYVLFFENTKFNDIPAISMLQYNQRKRKFYQNNGSRSNPNKVGKASLKYLIS